MTEHIPKAGIARHSDTWIGVVLIAVGAIGALAAQDFDTMSRSYPLTLAILLMVFGAMLIGRVVISAPKSVSFALPVRVAGSALAVLIPWVLAIAWGFGFVLPTILMQLALTLICGIRPVAKAALYAVLIAVVSYLVFVQGLGVRLPRPVLPWLI